MFQLKVTNCLEKLLFQVKQVVNGVSIEKSREDLDLLVSIEKRDPEATISSLYYKSKEDSK